MTVNSIAELCEFERRAGLGMYTSTNSAKETRPCQLLTAVVTNTVGVLFGAVCMDSQQSLPKITRVIYTLNPVSAANHA